MVLLTVYAAPMDSEDMQGEELLLKAKKMARPVYIPVYAPPPRIYYPPQPRIGKLGLLKG